VCKSLSRRWGLEKSLSGGVRYCKNQNAAHTSNQIRSCTQLFRLLLRNYQFTSEGLSLS